MYRVYNFLNALFLKTAYASYTDKGNDISGIGFLDQIKKGLSTLYNMIRSLAPWVAVIMAGVAIFKIMTGDDKQIQASKKQLIWVAVGFVGIYLVPEIINAIAVAFGTGA